MELCRSVYRSVEVVVVLGDITKVNVDAIVNPANTLMIMGGGVAKAIKNAGGEEIEIEARSKAPVPIGKAIATTAGKLRCRYVIHAPTVERPGDRSDEFKVRAAVKAALNLAKDLNISSIALPGMGTGVGGVPIDTASRIMIEEIKSHIDEGTSLKTIMLVSIDQALAKEFCRWLNEILR